MKKSRFSADQMVKILREADTGTVSEVAKKHGGYRSWELPVLMAMRELSAQYPRFGYRRILVFLERRAPLMGPDLAHRILWSEGGLQVPRKRPRRRVASSRPRPLPASAGPRA